MDRILIADDERNIAELLSDTLRDEGLDTVIAGDGEEVLSAVRSCGPFDLILLDIMMPNMDGLEALKKIRDITACPIILVSAKSRTLDKLVGLELGADDYVTKPFVVEELAAKVKAHIRRDRRNAPCDEALRLGDMLLYRARYEVVKNAEPIELTSREFQLLMYLYDHLGQVLTREQIFDDVWGMDYLDPGTVTVTIKNLRDKLDRDNRHIKTVWGVGYKLVT
jgi:DNA-binding response OmpR family regulator